MSAINYRTDIQGLRAVSVILVIFYHALSTLDKKEYLAGGFLGVDIFMVISGFVIWKVLTVKYKTAGPYLLFSFLDGRVRRLLPASLIILYISLIVGWLTLLPEDLLRLSRSIWKSLLFNANGHFATELTDYGAEQARLSPLLHFWSLSVEWKFYILILFSFIFLPKKNQALFLLLLITASLFLSLIEIGDLKNTSYFSFIGRVWEFGFGAYIAQRNLQVTGRSGAVLVLFGILMIGAPALSLSYVPDEYQVWHSLPVILGASLLLISDQDLKTKRFLTSKAMVSIGDMSYSLYLWHFLILSFYELLFPKITAPGVVICLTLTVALSKLTRMWIEIPLQTKRLNLKLFYGTTSFAIIMIYIMAFNIQENSGMSSRLGEAAKAYSDLNIFERFKDHSGRNCHNPINLKKPCIYHAGSGEEVLFIIGDSHAGTIAQPIANSEIAVTNTIVTYTFNSCPILKWISISRSANPKFKDYCRDITENVIEEIEAFPATKKTILYLSRLPFYIQGTGFDNKAGGVEILNESYKSHGLLTGEIENDIAASLIELSGIAERVFIVSPIPEAGWNVPRRMKVESGMFITQISDGLERKKIQVQREVVEQRLASTYEVFRRLPRDIEFTIIDTLSIFCSADHCFGNGDGELYYKDSNHLSPHGTELLLHGILPELLNK